MSWKRLQTLLFAGCLTLNAAGCRSCLVAPWSALGGRAPWAQRETCEVFPPDVPQVSADQHRPIPPDTSTSPEWLDSPFQNGDDAYADSPAAPAEPGDAAQDEQAQAVAGLRKLGARVSLDPDGHVTAVDLAQTAVTDADLALLVPCAEILELNLRGGLISDIGLKTIGTLSSIEFLGLTGTMVTDDGLPHLQQLGRLRFLTLGHTAVTDAGLATLAGCPELEGLNVKATAVTAAGLVELQAQLPNCRIVSDVTATSVIDSEDLPLPMTEENPATGTADTSLPDADQPIGLPESLGDPFTPLSPPAEPEELPPAPEDLPAPSDEIPAPPSARSIPGQRRSQVAVPNGPARRLDRVLKDSLGDPAVLRVIAQSYAARSEWDAAAAVLRAAVEHDPRSRDLQFELGVAEARSGDYVAALMHLQQCGDLAIAHYNLGVLLHEAGLHDASVLAFRSALRYDPQLTAARQWLSDLGAGRTTAAADDTGRRPAMSGSRPVTQVNGQFSDVSADPGPNDTSRIEMWPTGSRRAVVPRQKPIAVR